jgi:hypothetical protein
LKVKNYAVLKIAKVFWEMPFLGRSRARKELLVLINLTNPELAFSSIFYAMLMCITIVKCLIRHDTNVKEHALI